MTDDPHVNVQALSKTIARDQTLATKIIKVANSPFFNYPRIISTIDFAITVLGFETVKEIVLSASYIGYFKDYKDSLFNTKTFWSHLAVSTVICRELSKVIKYPLIEESFVAGLIHDIGMFVMSQFFPREFKILMTEIEKGETDLLALEQHIYGANHALIGSWLLKKWNFPHQLVEAVQFHHHPYSALNNKVLPALIYYTEYLTAAHSLGGFALEKNLGYNTQHLNILGFSDISEVDNIFIKNKEEIENEIAKTAILCG
jgi:HD-like signal output (HDOD) protein